MKKCAVWFGLFLGLYVGQAYAGLTIEITSGVDNPTPIAVAVSYTHLTLPTIYSV